jgi:hypothetical protein
LSLLPQRSSDLAIVEDLSLKPGAMELKLRREIPDGVIAYYEAEAGWLTQRGEPRVKPYRKYLWSPTDGDPVKLPSTSTILDAICPKDGIPYWSEARGIEGGLLAFKAGLLTVRSRAEDAIAVVREHKLGAEAAKNRAACRGLNVHAINEHYMLTGEAPKLSEHPAEHRGYIHSWVKCMLSLKLEPVEVETLVVHPEDGYAGRLDLRARHAGNLETIEMKTQERAGIYSTAHAQVGLYERAAIRCGAEPADRKRVIVLAADGQWDPRRDQMLADHDDPFVDAALAWWREKRPVDGACESRNRVERKARA